MALDANDGRQPVGSAKRDVGADEKATSSANRGGEGKVRLLVVVSYALNRRHEAGEQATHDAESCKEGKGGGHSHSGKRLRESEAERVECVETWLPRRTREEGGASKQRRNLGLSLESILKRLLDSLVQEVAKEDARAVAQPNGRKETSEVAEKPEFSATIEASCQPAPLGRS